jgi:hypothetical protein
MPIFLDPDGALLIKSGIGDVEVGAHIGELIDTGQWIGIVTVKALAEPGVVGQLHPGDPDIEAHWDQQALVWIFESSKSLKAAISMFERVLKEMEAKGL